MFFKVSLFVFIASFVFAASAQSVFADAWWGKGYRTPEWVIAHGGTIINYSSVGQRGAVEVKLYTSGKEIIEKEQGSSGKFDDGVAGQAYFLRAKSGSKKVRSGDFVLKRGSVNNVVIDFKKKTMTFL